jgi:hypothetical protein
MPVVEPYRTACLLAVTTVEYMNNSLPASKMPYNNISRIGNAMANSTIACAELFPLGDFFNLIS